MGRRRGQCSYPGCETYGRSTYANYNIRLCGDHWDQLSDYTFLPCRHLADVKLRTIIELEFIARCGSSVAKEELRRVQTGAQKVHLGGTAPWAEWRAPACLTAELLMLIQTRFGIRDPLGAAQVQSVELGESFSVDDEPVARAVKAQPLPRKPGRDALDDF